MIVKVKSKVIKVLSIKMFTILLPRHQFGKKSCSCYKVQTYPCVKIEHVLYIYVKYHKIFMHVLVVYREQIMIISVDLEQNKD